ncbi:MAG TPA: hypothetical protein DCS30_01110 [Rhizobiales bacterium]|uniref:Uncharacterized protein n=1 Tax=Cohaesibacter gelatinilyticus TaxID=372072 RepID=A0A285NET4_9HYPH|nr:hypothetical protein SAMN06265368_1362 [Cohaesibacter gelatinilyticus]HAT84677.1 hypothetical protein [Hyphomicrobiales bacterium]
MPTQFGHIEAEFYDPSQCQKVELSGKMGKASGAKLSNCLKIVQLSILFRNLCLLGYGDVPVDSLPKYYFVACCLLSFLQDELGCY